MGKFELFAAIDNYDARLVGIYLDDSDKVYGYYKDGLKKALKNTDAASAFLLADKLGESCEMEYSAELALCAAPYGYLEQIKRLHHKYSLDVNVTNRSGRTMLMEACANNHYDVVDWLLENKASMSLIDKRHANAMETAVNSGFEKCVGLMLKHGFDADHVNRNGDTMLSIAASKGDLDIVRLLVEHGADISSKESKNRWALCNAVFGSSTAVIDYLISNGIDREATNNRGDTALMVSASQDNAKVLDLLINKGCSVDPFHMRGWTPLHDAVRYDRPLNVAILLENGADPLKKDKDGLSPRDEAVSRGYAEVLKVIDSFLEKRHLDSVIDDCENANIMGF